MADTHTNPARLFGAQYAVKMKWLRRPENMFAMLKPQNNRMVGGAILVRLDWSVEKFPTISIPLAFFKECFSFTQALNVSFTIIARWDDAWGHRYIQEISDGVPLFDSETEEIFIQFSVAKFIFPDEKEKQ